MEFKSHIGRPFDIRSTSSLLAIALFVVAGVVGVVLWLNGEPAETIFFAPAYGFVTWALVREVDPDHNWSALVAAAGAAGWVLLGGGRVSILALGVLIMVGRLVTESTGRRPLLTDLVVLILAALTAFTVEGWVVAFGLAIALYLDARFSERSHPAQIWVSAAIAAGATLMATFTDAFPAAFPGVRPVVVIVSGMVALILVVRDPAEPISHVDARHKAFLAQDRLHASRSLVGVLVFGMALLTGSESAGLIPTVFGLALIVVSNEIELVRRRRL